MRTHSRGLLYVLLFLYAAASLTYYGAGVVALREEFFNGGQHAQLPFDLGDDGQTIAKIRKNAQQAGIRDGDVLLALNGSAYHGFLQFNNIVRRGRPGDPFEATVRTPQGRVETVRFPLAKWQQPNFSLGADIAVLTPMYFVPLLSLIVGFWVVAARPSDPNAWLVLMLLTFSEIVFGNLDPKFWGGAFTTVLLAWFLFHQQLVFMALLWFGVYFPERWRVDARWPWIKWTLTAVMLASFFAEIDVYWDQYFDVRRMAGMLPYEAAIDRVSGWSMVAAIAVFLVAIFDKLRSASTADARRRLRVLALGSAVSLGGMVIVQALLPHSGLKVPEWLQLVVVVPLVVIFPFTLAYVVIVQRAMDVRILLRMGTKYLLAKATVIVVEIAIVVLLVMGLIGLVNRQAGRLPVLVAVGALAIGTARLFSRGQRRGVSSRLNQWIDRRFFREAYDAEVVLSELSEDARRFTERESLIETVSRRIADVLHIEQIAVWLRASQVFHLQQTLGADGVGAMALGESSATIQNLTRTKRPATVYRDRPEEWLRDADPAEKQVLDAVKAEVLLPLPGRERLLGVMALGPKKSEEPYTPNDMRLLQSVATQTGLALEVSALAHSLAQEAAQRERVNREIEIAREVQQRLFPQRLPEIAGVSLAGMCRPALGVGGDYYDLIELQNGQIGIAVGDVSGKGISAALLMASLRASLRGMTLEGSSDLAKTMKQVNRLVYEASANNRYATFFFATYDPGTRVLRYVNAGHNPPVLIRASAKDGPDGGTKPLRMEAGGVVVGLLPNVPYAEATVQLEPGDVFLAYTDGISEAMTAEDEEWGEERMIAAAEAARSGTAGEILEAVFRAADVFTAEAPQHDDMTLLVMKLEASRTV